MNHQLKNLAIFFVLCAGTWMGGRVYTVQHAQSYFEYNGQNTYWLPTIFNDTAGGKNQAVVPNGPIAISPVDGLIWVSNPDSGSLSVVDPNLGIKLDEIQVGAEPWSLAINDQTDEVYVLDRAIGEMKVLDQKDRSIVGSLFVGPEPYSMAIDNVSQRAYVTLNSAAQIVVIDLNALSLVESIDVGNYPMGILLTEDKIIVTHQLAFQAEGGEEARDDGRAGKLTVISTETNQVEKEIVLEPNREGIPNLLAYPSMANGTIWVPHVRAAPDLPAGLTTSVFAAVSAVDGVTLEHNPQSYLPLNDQAIFGSPVNNPVAVVPSPDGQLIYVVLAGSDLIEVIDVSDPENPELVRFLPAGSNPRGMAISADGRFGYVMSYLSRSVTVLDLENLELVSEIQVTDEPLSQAVLEGKKLFNLANDPRLSNGAWISCASCHPNGAHDGLTWMFPDGPRQTPPLWNVAHTAPFHWSAALDELQDVEDTIHGIQHGLGLAGGQDPELLGVPNRGRSTDLDALALFMQSNIRTPNIPIMFDEGAVQNGREIFITQGCHSCHGGPNWTTSALPGMVGTLDPDQNLQIDAVLHDVGTGNGRNIRGELGFDVPSLLNVAVTPPYLHDGSLFDLTSVVESGHPNPSQPVQLSPEEINNLVLFLRSIGSTTNSIDSD